jgi:hypothetical protein
MKPSKQTKPLSALRLYTAAIEQKPIIVYMANEPIGFGVIEEVTDQAVKIEDEYYMRDICTFYLHNNHQNLTPVQHISK